MRTTWRCASLVFVISVLVASCGGLSADERWADRSGPESPDDPRALGEERGEEDGCRGFLRRYRVQELRIGVARGTFDDCQYNRLWEVVARELIRRTLSFSRPLPR